jgi:hypothetical protein
MQLQMMQLHEVVVHAVKRDGARVVLDLLRMRFVTLPKRRMCILIERLCLSTNDGAAVGSLGLEPLERMRNSSTQQGKRKRCAAMRATSDREIGVRRAILLMHGTAPEPPDG